MSKTKLIIALDLPTLKTARETLERLQGLDLYYKIGPALFTGEGPSAVELAGLYGKGVFLDLKLHDIPNTVKSAVEQAGRLGVFALSLHSAGGPDMLRAAAAVPVRPRLWGITVLTSFEPMSFLKTGFRYTMEKTVDDLAALAVECGLDGVVASPGEAAWLRRKLGPDREIITPGIRYAPGDNGPAAAREGSDDQKRTMTPAEAAAAGADFIVVGRPVINAPDPAAAAAAILKEIAR